MGNKYSRSGGKFSGNHTTLIPAAATIADIAHRCPHVTKISPGFIKAGLKSVNGKKRIKISDDGPSILLSVRDNTSHQELHIYSTNMQETKSTIARDARKIGLQVKFGI